MDVFIHLYDWLVYLPMGVLYIIDFPVMTLQDISLEPNA